jgi:hypothetical protein
VQESRRPGQAQNGAEWLATLVLARYPDVMTLTPITIDPAVCTGKRCISS